MTAIPFNKPKLAGKELDHIAAAVELGQLAGDGSFTKRCHALLEQRGLGKRALLTHSCTAALEMAAMLAELGPGDEVIMPSYTFVSTANAVCLQGATPVFVDINESSLCLDPEHIIGAITPQTRAICCVHYAGFIFAMEALQQIAKDHGLLLIEDAAQALGSSFRGQPAGTFGDASAFSFHETKNIISGEGGFLAVNREDWIARAEIIREKGTNRAMFFRGLVDKYTWVDIGSSYLPGELIAAFLYAQLTELDAINAERMQAWQRYDAFFRSDCNFGDQLRLPEVPAGCEHNAHMYFVRLPSLAMRQRFIDHMRSHDIMTPFHYVPLHSAPAGTQHARCGSEMVVTDSVADTLVRLPLFRLQAKLQERILAAIDTFEF